jgi:RHS repeat-associated protein
VSFKYDPFGRRIYTTSTAATTTYVYDGSNIEEELNGTAGTLGEQFTYGPGIDEPLVGQRQPQIYYYEADGLGSVTSLTEPTGAVAATYTYDSFGNTTNSTGSATNWFRYTGREYDSTGGLYYYRARYYDPEMGRFLSEDPMRFSAGSNFYPYVRNSPLDLTDPTGLCSNNNCPSALTQLFYASEIASNPETLGAVEDAFLLAQLTGNTVVVGISGNVGASLLAGEFLGGSAGASVGLGVDPAGDVGLVVSGQVGGGYRLLTGTGYAGGVSVTFTQKPTIFGLTGTSPVAGVSGGLEFGGSVTHTLSGSTTITAGVAGGVNTLGGVTGTKVFPLICP